MKLNEFIEIAKKKFTGNPEIIVVTDKGFQEIEEILPRSSYYDESFFGSTHEKGNFICIELKDKL